MRRRWSRSSRFTRLVAVATLVGGSVAAASSPVAAGGPVTVTYPSVSCSQEAGLQGCIASVEAGSTIHIATEIVAEDIKITKGIRLLGLPDIRPKIDSIDITGTTPVIDVQLRDLRVLGGIWAKFSGSPGHAITIEQVDVLGTVPNTGSGITVQTTVAATFILERSSVRKVQVGRDNVQFDTSIASGATTFRAIGNRLSQHGFNGSAGFFVRHSQAGTHHIELMNNRVWDVGACSCGLNSSIAIAVAGTAVVDADIVGNTIDTSGGAGVMLRNDLEGEGSFTADVFDNIIAHTKAAAIARGSVTGATTSVRNGFNAIHRTGSAPGSPFFGPGTRFVDPGFIKRSTGDLRLKASSPLIDRGVVCSPGGVADPDASGHHRLAGASVDIGAYESGATAPTGIVVVSDGSPSALHVGTAGADILCGYQGEDTLDGMGGPDFVDGGAGPDRLIGGPGADRLFGRGGADVLCALDGHGTDRLDGGPAIDRFSADPGDRRTSVETSDPCSFSQ